MRPSAAPFRGGDGGVRIRRQEALDKSRRELARPGQLLASSFFPSPLRARIGLLAWPRQDDTRSPAGMRGSRACLARVRAALAAAAERRAPPVSGCCFPPPRDRCVRRAKLARLRPICLGGSRHRGGLRTWFEPPGNNGATRPAETTRDAERRDPPVEPSHLGWLRSIRLPKPLLIPRSLVRSQPGPCRRLLQVPPVEAYAVCPPSNRT